MNYLCTDRGSLRCPCHLMATGQCYTCTMVRKGICSCEEAAGWQGICPYTVYCQQGERVLPAGADSVSQFDVLTKTDYGGGLHVVRLKVPRGFFEECRRPGTYIMAEALGWRTPVSVLRCEGGGGSAGDGSGCDDGWSVEFLVKETGPKSRELIRMAEEDGCWKAAGPYYNGLLQADQLEQWMEAGRQQWRGEKKEKLLAVVRGSAAAPLLHLLDSLQEADCQVRLYLDDENLPESFLENYLTGQVYQRIRLQDGYTLKRMKYLIQAAAADFADSSETMQQIMVLVSPHYMEQLLDGLSGHVRSRIILPNQANLCCGMGLCGSCSHTDRDGVTVKLCKCSQTVLE